MKNLTQVALNPDLIGGAMTPRHKVIFLGDFVPSCFCVLFDLILKVLSF